MNAANKLVKARTGLILDMPFFGALALRLTLVENADIKTMRTDGSVIEYNPAFVDALSLGEVKGVIAHEVMHCACGHHLRRGARAVKKWNHAADYAINGILNKSQAQLPKGALLDPRFDDMSAEAIYARLPDESGDGSSTGGQQGADTGDGIGDVVDAKNADGKPLSEAEAEQQAAEWKIAVAQSAQQARGMGAMPAALDRLVKEIVEARVDWRETLRRFVQQAARNDYRWTPPNRRHVHAGLFLPSLRGEQLPPVIVAVDTSGSIGRQELDQFAGELTSILEEYATECHVIYCDAAVQAIDVFKKEDLPVRLNAKGGGGTDFRPVFTWATMQDFQPCCIVYLTDMQGMFPDAEPAWPTLWVSTSAVDKAPFGEVVRI